MLKLKIAVTGVKGQMGQALVKGILADENLTLGTVTVKEDAIEIGKTLNIINPNFPSENAIASFAELSDGNFDVLIDFSHHNSAIKHTELCAKLNKPIVLGMTGLTAEQILAIQNYGKKISIVQAPNMSLGMNLLYQLLAKVAKALPEADAEIIEAHHNIKKDAPSGAALHMAKQISAAREMQDNFNTGRSGNASRTKSEIGINSIRAGDIIGEHTALFAFPGESLEITHKAHDRMIFARGALHAAKWLVKQPAGVYGMSEVLQQL